MKHDTDLPTELMARNDGTCLRELITAGEAGDSIPGQSTAISLAAEDDHAWAERSAHWQQQAVGTPRHPHQKRGHVIRLSLADAGSGYELIAARFSLRTASRIARSNAKNGGSSPATPICPPGLSLSMLTAASRSMFSHGCLHKRSCSFR